MVGGHAVTHPGLFCASPTSQKNPFLWNKFADGKLLFCNTQLLQAVWANQDWRVREFWRVLAICHTVMVQEMNSECPLNPGVGWARISQMLSHQLPEPSHHD